MSASSVPTTSERVLGLLIITGFMLLIVAIPLGLVLSLQDHDKFHSDLALAVSLGTLMTAAMPLSAAYFLVSASLARR
jgi:hypothetical protein